MSDAATDTKDIRPIIAAHFRGGRFTITDVFDAIAKLKKDINNVSINEPFRKLIQDRSNWGLCEYIENHFTTQADGVIDFNHVRPFILHDPERIKLKRL